MQQLLKYLPIAFTTLLVIWTAAVSPFSKYGDNWAIVPAITILPITLCVHVVLLIVAEERRPQVFYAVIHLGLQFVIWIYCLMRISKDSL